MSILKTTKFIRRTSRKYQGKRGRTQKLSKFREFRVKNKTLNKIYSKGKELNRKQEFEKGISKFIFKIKTNNAEYTEKRTF